MRSFRESQSRALPHQQVFAGGLRRSGALQPAVSSLSATLLFDMVIGDSYFRYDVVSVGQLDKVQVIDAMWDNKEKRREEPFLSLRLMHAEEAHLLLALEDDERKSLLTFASAVAAVRNPEK